MANKFKAGDTVKLKTGSHTMTVKGNAYQSSKQGMSRYQINMNVCGLMETKLKQQFSVKTFCNSLMFRDKSSRIINYLFVVIIMLIMAQLLNLHLEHQ